MDQRRADVARENLFLLDQQEQAVEAAYREEKERIAACRAKWLSELSAATGR